MSSLILAEAGRIICAGSALQQIARPENPMTAVLFHFKILILCNL
jgi:hypothetical protein